jgi:hypothetical protein
MNPEPPVIRIFMGQDLRNLEQKTFRHSEDFLNERGLRWGRKLADLSG